VDGDALPPGTKPFISGPGPRATVSAVRYAAAAHLRRTDHPNCFIVRLHPGHAAAARPPSTDGAAGNPLGVASRVDCS